MTAARVRHRRPRGQAGFTLVEMMISLVIMSIAIAAVLGLGNTLMNGYRESRRVVLAERSARASLDVISNTIRNTSPAVPKGEIYDLVSCSTSGALRVVNSTTAPDELEVVHAIGGLVTTLRTTFTAVSTSIEVSDGSNFQAGDYILISNLEKGVLVQITNVQPSSGGHELTLVSAPSALCGGTVFTDTFETGHLVLRAQVTRFYVENSVATGNIPTLMIDPDGAGAASAEPMAAGIEDMQIAVGVDASGEGLVFEDTSTTDEWHYNVAGDATPPLASVTPPRAYRVTLVGRTIVESSNRNLYRRPAVEDRAQGSSADPFRRRVLTATIELRNLDGSP